MASNSEYQLTAVEVDSRQAIHGFQLSPDGQWLSFISQRDKISVEAEENGHRKVKETAVSDLCLILSSGGYPRLLTNTGDVKKPGSWSPDGKSLVFSQGGELKLLELWEATPNRLSISGFRTLYKGKLYNPKLADVGDDYLSYPRWRPRKEDFLLFATREDDQTTLRAVSHDGCKQLKLYSVSGTILGWNWSPDGNAILFVTRDKNRLDGHICLLDFESSSLITRLTSKERFYKYYLPAASWTPDGKRIVFRSNRSGWAKLWSASAIGSDPAN
jgi:Tol biopolymer transport system component